MLDIAGAASGSSAWSSKPAAGDGVYYTSSSSGLGPDFSKVFSFVVPAGTPADTYLLRMGVGRGSLGGEFTDVSLTVGEVPEPATLAMLLGGRRGTGLLAGTKHLAAK